MADEHQFIENGLQRTQIDEFFAQELSRAGYGGMDVAKTPMGTQIVLKAEKPGMVIGKGGKNIRKITSQLEEQFDLDDPQIDVQEVDEPDLNAQIVADRLANALERGWYFRKAGHTTIDRIMDSGALGAEIVLSGKVTGARSRVEKFNRGYIKHNGEPAEEIVDEGIGTAVMKLGTIGVQVRIIPPDAQLPDDFRVDEGADVEAFIEEPAGEVDELLAEADEAIEGDEVDAPADEDAAASDDDAEAAIEEEEIDVEEGKSPTSPPDSAETPEAELDEIEEELGDLEADTEAEAEELLDEMDEADEAEPAEGESVDEEDVEEALETEGEPGVEAEEADSENVADSVEEPEADEAADEDEAEAAEPEADEADADADEESEADEADAEGADDEESEAEADDADDEEGEE